MSLSTRRARLQRHVQRARVRSGVTSNACHECHLRPLHHSVAAEAGDSVGTGRASCRPMIEKAGGGAIMLSAEGMAATQMSESLPLRRMLRFVGRCASAKGDSRSGARKTVNARQGKVRCRRAVRNLSVGSVCAGGSAAHALPKWAQAAHAAMAPARAVLRHQQSSVAHRRARRTARRRRRFLRAMVLRVGAARVACCNVTGCSIPQAGNQAMKIFSGQAASEAFCCLEPTK